MSAKEINSNSNGIQENGNGGGAKENSNGKGTAEAIETRVAIIGIIVENMESVEKLNIILHQHAEYIIGRMGIPYRQKNLHVISVVMDAPPDVINALSGKIGCLPGIRVKTAYSGAVTCQCDADGE